MNTPAPVPAQTLPPFLLTQDALKNLNSAVPSAEKDQGPHEISVPMSGIERTIISIAIALIIMSAFVVIFYRKPAQPIDQLGL